jgi:hypothetical protein
MARDKFFKSEQTLSGAQINTDELAAVVIQYVKAISQGNYNFKISNTKDGFTQQQKSHFIKQLLNNSTVDFHLLEIPESIDANLANIVNLAASLMLFEKISNLTSSPEKLEALQSAGIASFVKAGMPGPIIIYANTIEKSDKFDKISMVSILGDLLNKLTTQANTFTILTPVAFTSIFQNWTNTVSLLRDNQRTLLSRELTKLSNINQTLSQMTDTVEFTFIDKCVSTIWDKLKINIHPPILIDGVNQDDPNNNANLI